MPPTRKTSLEKKLVNATVTPDEVYKYLTIDKGLSHEHAMGMLPNIVEESEFIYNRIQNDAKYDPDHSKGKQGIGLFQYTEPTRRKNFVEAVPDWQTNWKGQIDFALSEPETKRYLDQSFDTIEDASRYFTTDWERPRNKYRQAEKRLNYVPGLIDQIEAQNTKPYASETFQSYVMPPVNVVEKDPIKEYIDLNSNDIINDLALAGQQMNYFNNGGGKLKKNYAVTDSKKILFDPDYTPPSEPKTFSDKVYDRFVERGQSNSQLENLYEFFDMTGISSWDDAAAAYDQWNRSGRTYPTVEEGVDMFGAVPALGKLGNIRYLSGSNMHKGFQLGKNLIYKYIPWQEIINKVDALQDSYEDYSQDYDTKLKFAQGGARNVNNMKRYYATGGVDNTPVLSVRNNNPGNLRYSENLTRPGYVLEGATKGDGGFAKFNTIEEGVEAMKKQLRLDLVKRGMTLEDFLNKYAPPTENKTDAYINNIAKTLGIDPEDKVSSNKIDDLAAAMIIQEGGKEAIDYYKNALPETSVRNALSSFNIDNTLDNTAQALGLPTSEEMQDKLLQYESMKSYDELVAKGERDPYIINSNYDLNSPQSEQFLAFNPDLAEYLQGTDNITSSPSTEQPTQAQATSRAPGYENMTAEDLQNIYQGLLEADAAAAAGDGVYPLVSGTFEPGPQAPQFLARRMQGSTSSGSADSNSAGSSTMSSSDLEQLRNMMQGERTPSMSSEIDYQKEFKNATPDSVDRNLLAKLKGQDYMGLLTDIGAYAARMAPLSRAMREASSYDEERYPRFSPILPTATLPKRDVRDAFATAQQAALQQGRLDLGALSALATQQAKETARVEENIANERVGLLNQAQQINNQLTMQEMADTAANKGAAQTMKYQALAAMSEMGQGSLREANMRRNDKIVKEMFESVFDELREIKSSRA